MPRDAVSRTANVERNGGHKWVKTYRFPDVYQSFESFMFVAGFPIKFLCIQIYVEVNAIVLKIDRTLIDIVNVRFVEQRNSET